MMTENQSNVPQEDSDAWWEKAFLHLKKHVSKNGEKHLRFSNDPLSGVTPCIILCWRSSQGEKKNLTITNHCDI